MNLAHFSLSLVSHKRLMRKKTCYLKEEENSKRKTETAICVCICDRQIPHTDAFT